MRVGMLRIDLENRGACRVRSAQIGATEALLGVAVQAFYVSRRLDLNFRVILRTNTGILYRRRVA